MLIWLKKIINSLWTCGMAEVNNVSRITGTWTWNVDISHSGYLYYYIIEYLCTYEWGTMRRKRIRLKTCSRVIPSAFSRRQSYYKEADMKNCGLIFKKIRKSTGCHSILPEARLSEGECTKRHYNLPLARQTEWERDRERRDWERETEKEKHKQRWQRGWVWISSVDSITVLNVAPALCRRGCP